MTGLERLGRFEARHAKVVVGVWIIAVLGAFALSLGLLGNSSLFERLSTGQPDVPGEARTGSDLLTTQAADGTRVLVVVDGVDPASTSVRADVQALARTLAAGEDVAAVRTPSSVPQPQRAGMLARDGHALALVVQLEPDLPSRVETERARWVQTQASTALRAVPGARVTTGSTPQLVDEITHQLEVDLRTGEGVALPVSLLVMVLVFGGFIAAGLPIAGAVASIAGGLASLWAFSRIIDLDATVVNVVTIMGLGLCIDYGLLVVSRFREELRRVDDVETALGRTVAVAGRTVLFSALIVAICLCALLLFEAPILRALGAAGVSVVVVALLVGLSLVPALVALAGRRLIRPGLPSRVPGLRAVLARLGDVAPERGAFSRLSGVVQRRPWWVAIGVAAVLLAAAAPALGMHLRSSGPELMPVGSNQRDFFDRLDARFPALAGPDITVVTRGTAAQVTAWSREVARLSGVADVVPPTAADRSRSQGSLVVLGVHVVGGDGGGPTATDVVRALRADRPDFPTWVTGQAAGQIDFSAAITRRAPLAIGLVMVVTFALLFLMTGSVLVPIKALVMNVVSLGASLGVVTWIFQDGHLSGLLAFTSTGGVETTVPPLVLAFGFGLAMDYEVFLLSRIKEHHDAGLSNDEAVTAGLQHSGRIITSAALLVVIVFAGLIAGRVLVVKQTGVALTVAVAIDATLVRMLLVPATMTLLGEWNWWAPAPLRRLHGRFGIGA